MMNLCDVQEMLYYLRFVIVAYVVALLILALWLPHMSNGQQAPGTAQRRPAGTRQEEL